MRRTSRTLLAVAMLVPLFVLQPLPKLQGAPLLRAAPGGCCGSSCACTPAASCGCQVRAPRPAHSPDPIAPAVSQSVPVPAFVQHPADGGAVVRVAVAPLAPTAEPEAYKHPGRLLDLVCVLIV